MEQKMMKTPSAPGEFALWLLATVFLSALALLAMGTAKAVLGWSDSQWIISSVAVGIFSATWGSWAALIWTRSRALRSLMIAVAVLPGVLMIAVGMWAFLTVPDNRWIWRWGWLILAGHGVGAVAMTILFGGRELLARAPLWVRSRRLAMGWTLYPILVVAGSVGLVAAAFALMPDLVAGSDEMLETLARWIIPAQALVLLTTGLPAFSAHICRYLTRDRGHS